MTYKHVDEMLMEQELNSKIFRGDPIKKILDPNRNRTDRFNNNYLMELKCRYHSIDLIKSWGGATIEKDKYSPSLEVAFKISNVFRVPLEDVFSYE